MVGSRPPVRVALAGFGAIGREPGQALMSGVPGYQLVAVAVTDQQRAAGGSAAMDSDAVVCEFCESGPSGRRPVVAARRREVVRHG